MKNSIVLLILFAFLPLATQAQADKPRRSDASGTLFQPAKEEFQDSYLSKLKVPAGYQIGIFAKGLVNPRMMVVDSQGNVYVSRPKQKDIVKLIDGNHDGVADGQEVLVSGYDRAHGMTLKGDTMYFIAMKKIYSVDIKNPSKVKLLVDNLPDVGQHENRSIHLGPDGRLYFNIGSTCNLCSDPNKQFATIQSMNLDGSDMKTVASGLRDTIGFDWHPETGQLYGWDHGSDWNGDTVPKEELNALTEGKHYGWPYCWNEKKPESNYINDPEPQTKEQFCPTTEAPVLTYHAHGAPLGFQFYKGGMLVNDRNSAFVAMHGSWNRKNPVGYSVVKVVFQNGKPVKTEEFLTGFLAPDKQSQFGRPIGIAMMNDGSLLVSDDSGGVIYRITYTGSKFAQFSKLSNDF